VEVDDREQSTSTTSTTTGDDVDDDEAPPLPLLLQPLERESSMRILAETCAIVETLPFSPVGAI